MSEVDDVVDPEASVEVSPVPGPRERWEATLRVRFGTRGWILRSSGKTRETAILALERDLMELSGR